MPLNTCYEVKTIMRSSINILEVNPSQSICGKSSILICKSKIHTRQDNQAIPIMVICSQ